VYEYGLLDPTEGYEEIDHQLRLAQAYYNDMCELEHRLRAELLEARLWDEVVEGKKERKLPRSAPTGEFGAERKALRGKYSAQGLYYGTYLLTEQAFDQARAMAWKCDDVTEWMRLPRFRSSRHLRGRGEIAVQISGGISVDTLHEMSDSRVRAGRPPEGAYDEATPRGERWRLARTELQIRVASESRKPVWARFPMIMHRPLPPNGVVKWAKVLRIPWEQGHQWKWKVLFVIDDRVDAKPAKTGPSIVAVNLGWRLMGEGELRLATWVGSDGREGELRMGGSLTERWWRACRIRSRRDLDLNALREALVELGVNCGRWKSFDRFHRLLRSEGLTDEARAVLAPWAARDRHLWWYERGCRGHALKCRREQYRLLAAQLAAEYDAIVVEDYDLREIVTNPERQQLPSRQRVEGAPSEARAALRSAGTREGCVVIDGESRGATQRCHVCGCAEPWDAARNVMHTCPDCSTVWDQDVNNCRNMLAAATSGDEVAAAREALEAKGARYVGRHARAKKAKKEREEKDGKEGRSKGDGEAM